MVEIIDAIIRLGDAIPGWSPWVVLVGGFGMAFFVHWRYFLQPLRDSVIETNKALVAQREAEFEQRCKWAEERSASAARTEKAMEATVAVVEQLRHDHTQQRLTAEMTAEHVKEIKTRLTGMGS